MHRNEELNYTYQMLTATPTQVKCAQEFAPRYTSSVANEYAMRGQSDIKLICQQAFASKIFEFMIYNHLSQFGKCTTPDTRIYSSGMKSFDADLIYSDSKGTLHVHVKSQELSRIRNREWISWGFQKRDKLFSVPKSNDLIMSGVYVNPYEGHLLVQNSAYDIMNYARDAKNSKVGSSKQFIYYRDLINPL